MQASSRHAGECIFCAAGSHLRHVRRQQFPRLTISRFLSTVPDQARQSFTIHKVYGIKDAQDHARGSGRNSGRSRDRHHDRGGEREYGLPRHRRAERDGKNTEDRTRPTERGRGRGGNDRFAGRKLKFHEVLYERMKKVKSELREAPITQHLGRNDASFDQLWTSFASSILTTSPITITRGVADKKKEYQALRDAYYDRGISSLDDRLKYAFYDHVTGSRFTESDVRNQKALADLRYPTEWFPSTRTMHRTIHLHVGPTNSGKTYHALKRLEQADSGVYAGPLRLLAHEVYTRLNAKGKRCTLITGEEKRSPDDSLGSEMQSCTVEMMPLNKTVDVAVIDEIQMIGNAERGWAWTQALLGVKAREVHLCGEVRTVPLIRELCASIGEKLEVHQYERLSPLQMADKGLDGDLNLLRKGDCIVSFSVMGIHALRRQIEKVTGRKVATVYGSLPPETRAQQARLFNDPDNDYDFLVASDAIGMGLNLSIKRIIFETSSKFDGFRQRPLAIADVKQIGGRAGRYRSAHQDNESAKIVQDLGAIKGEDPPVEVETSQPKSDISPTPDSSLERSALGAAAQSTNVHSTRPTSSTVGLVTTLEKFDFPVIAAAMKAEPEPIRTAGIFPPAPIVERFATYFPPGTPFSYILMRLHELSQMHSRFHLCGLKDQLWIADLIEPVQGLTTTDRNILCACPASKTEDLFKHLMPAFARCIEQQSGGSLFEMQEIPLETLELEVSASRDYLRQLERLHKAVVAYLWLSYRFAGIFTTRPLAFHVKGLVEEKIEEVLSQFSFTEAQRKKITAAREQSILESLKRDTMSGDGAEPRSQTSLTRDVASNPEGQTSYAVGGDRFSGEEDAVIMDPVEDAGRDATISVSELAESAPTVAADMAAKNHASSFAEWRASQTKIRDEDELGFDWSSRPGQAQMHERGELLGPEEQVFDPASTSNEETPIGNAASGVVPETESEGSSPPLETQFEPPITTSSQAKSAGRHSEDLRALMSRSRQEPR